MKRPRCSHKKCNKKLKLTDMSCKCSKIFCQKHRLPETHECTWNPKNEESMKKWITLAGLDQKVLFKKVEEI